MMPRIRSGSLATYLVTDSELSGPRGVVDTVQQAIDGGVTIVQLREKSASTRSIYTTLCALAEAIDGRALLLVNDRVDVYLAAKAAGARVDGVHLGQSDLPAALARELIGPNAILGVSAVTAGEIAETATQDVDYLGIGPIRATATKPDNNPPIGIDGFAASAALTPLPCVAIGGIGPADARALRRAGADGIAVVSYICASTDPRAAAQRLSAEFQNESI